MKELIQNNIVHRDLKPENILISSEYFKVADFGMAAKVDIRKQQLMKEYVGSPLYMSPQILLQEEYTSKSDVWSIGLIFYELLFGKTPWPCRDIHSLIRNIQTTSLRFPYDKPINTITKDFLVRSLEIEEEQRMSWDDVFDHCLFKNDFDDYPIVFEFPQIQLDTLSKGVIQGLQQVLLCYNMSIQEIFKKFDTNDDGTLDTEEFYKLLRTIDKRITSRESDHLFKKLDKSKDGLICYNEFMALFDHYDFLDSKDQATVIINELREIVKTYKINIEQIFDELDKDRGGSLDLNEFTVFMKRIAPALNLYEIEEVFKKFDIDKDNTLSFEEFEATLMRGVPGQEYKYDLDMERAVKKLMMTLEKRVTQKEIQLAFNFIDINQDGIVDGDDFMQIFK